MFTTEFDRPKTNPQAGGMGAGAAIFNRIERRPRRSKWLIAAPVGVVAVFAVGALVAYESMNRPAPAAAPAPALAVPAQAPAASSAAPPPVVQATPAQPAISAPAPVRHRPVVQHEHRAPRTGRVVANAPANLPAVTLPRVSAPDVSTAAPPPAAQAPAPTPTPAPAPVPTVTAPPPPQS